MTSVLEKVTNLEVVSNLIADAAKENVEVSFKITLRLITS